MRICFVNLTFYPHIGGVETFIYEISKRLAKAGHSVIVVTTSDNCFHRKVPNYEILEGIRVFRVPKDQLYLLRMMLKLIEVKLKHGIDLVHTNCGITAILSLPLRMLFQVPLVNASYGAWMICPNGGDLSFNGNFCSGFEPKKCSICLHKSSFILRIIMFLLREASKKVDLYITLCKYIKRLIKHVLPNKKIYIVPAGVDIKKFDINKYDNIKLRVKSKFHLSEHDKVVLFVGRHIYGKGIEYLLRALSRTKVSVPDLKAIIVGDGPERADLEKMSHKLGIQEIVFFPGFLSEKDLLEVYAMSDVLVLPSLEGIIEAFGIVQVEAMAMGKPVVATEVGGIPEVVVNKVTGLLVEPKNCDQLAEALVRILSDAKIKANMGMAGRYRVEKNFTWNVVVLKMLMVYEEVLESKFLRKPEIIYDRSE